MTCTAAPSATLPVGMHVFERGWLSANNILFADGDKTTLIDSGYCTHAAQTLSLVESVLGNRPLDILVNTHLHSDHCGGNASLQLRYPDLKTLIPPGHAAEVTCWDPVALTYLPTGQLCPQYTFTEVLVPGSSMRLGSRDWQVHSAPGHDPHSVIFYEPFEGILISADALWENGFGVVFPELEGDDAFGQVAATLNLIEQLQPKTIIPGHGRVFTYTSGVMQKAHGRLSSFVSDPVKHARHAVKVLLKYKLLEVQRQSSAEFMQWALSTSYFQQINSKFFQGVAIRPWLDGLIVELVQAGVAQRKDGDVFNV